MFFMQEDFLLEFLAAADDTRLVSPLEALDEAVDEMHRVYGCRDEILKNVEEVRAFYKNPGANLVVAGQLAEWVQESYKLFCERVAVLLIRSSRSPSRRISPD